MKRLFHLLLSSTLLIVASCSGNDKCMSNLFRWKSISAASDSVMIALEEGFISMMPADSLQMLASRLEHESTESPHGRQLLCRHYFWRGRIANREREDARQFLKMALQLCDSARYPYDHMRICYLQSILDSRQSQSLFYGKLKGFEVFATATGDHFIHASLLLDMGHIWSDIDNIPRALENYLEADSIYRELGITIYHLKTTLNNINVLHKAGRTRESAALCHSLLENPDASNDFDFYNDLRLTTYNVTGDTSQLLSGYHELSGKNAYERRKIRYELALGQHALARGDVTGALQYTKLATSHQPTPLTQEYNGEIYRLAYDTYETAGNHDSAYTYLRLLALNRDSLLRENSAMRINSIENQSEISRLEQTSRQKQKEERTSMTIAILSVMLVAMAVVMILMRRSQRNTIALMESQLHLERSQRSMVSSALAMTEKDNVLESVLDRIGTLADDGKICREESSRLQQSIRMHLSGKQEWADFQHMFEEVHPAFAATLKQRYPELSEGDLRLATYIRLGMQTKQIARMLLLQPESVKKNRLRLRRRMHLGREDSLEDILRSI